MQEIQKIERSYEIAWAGVLAIHLTVSRKLKFVRLEEYFSGVYLAARETLLLYWENASSLDGFVRDHCGLVDPPWFYWIEFYHAMKSRLEEGVGAVYSKDLAKVMNYAARRALKTGGKHGKKPQLEVEHFLSGLTAHPKLRFARRLLASGFEIRKRDIGTLPKGSD